TENVHSERFVTGFHVGQRRVEEDVREQRQEAVTEEMPEEVRTLGPATAQPRAENDVGDAACDRLDQLRYVDRVVLEIRVLDHGDVPVRVRNRGADGGALAA